MAALRLSHLSGAALLFLLTACGDQNPAAPAFTRTAAEPRLVLLDGLASIDGRFSNAVPEPGSSPSPVYCGSGAGQPTCVSLGFPANPSSQVRWGTPAGGGRSGLGFQGSTGLTINTNTEFLLGPLTHFNFPVSGSIDAVTLTFTVTLPGTDGFTANFPVRFDVDETPNVTPCKYPTSGLPCADRITWSLPQPTAIVQNGNVYALNIKGFRTSTSVASPLLSGFISDENQQTVVYLFAEVADATAQTHAIDDAYSTEPGTTLTIPANGVRDNDHDVSSVLVAAQPQHGTLSLSANGSFAYTPNAGFSGDDSFVYFGRLTSGELSLATVTIHVADRTAPTVTVPADITAEATGPTGATVPYTASATDAVDGAIVPSCSPASGAMFGVGATTVTCTATDAAGNAASATFTVRVKDTTAPHLSPRPNMVVEATSAAGAVATWTPVLASDLVDGTIAASCAPASGSSFSLGVTTVTCSVSDAAGNTASTSFSVSVEDHTAPSLALPANIVLYPLSPTGATAAWVATAQDLVSGPVPVACSPASGSFFVAATTTTVSCTATDAAGNTAHGSFTVRVRTIEELLDLLVSRSTGLGEGRNLEQLAGNIRATFLRGNERASCGQLSAYLYQVSAQAAQLSASQSAELTALAKLVQQVIGC